MAKVKKAATLKEVVTEKKAAPRTRKPRVSKKVDDPAAIGDIVMHRSAANLAKSVPVMQKTKLPTIEQIVAKLEKHGIRFDEE